MVLLVFLGATLGECRHGAAAQKVFYLQNVVSSDVSSPPRLLEKLAAELGKALQMELMEGYGRL